MLSSIKEDIDRHIDVELEYHEDDPAYLFLSRLCDLPAESDELVLYNK